MNVLLKGIVGSTAYGLAGPDSDVDRLGMYAAPTEVFLGVHPPIERSLTVVQHEPDVTMHEAGKFARLALSCNPSVLELLWLPDYEVMTRFGLDAIAIRRAFLSAPRVRDAYLGYAKQQYHRLFETYDKSQNIRRAKLAKHARHLMRLCHQGFYLYTTGDLIIKLADPGSFHAFGELVAKEVAGHNYGEAKKMIDFYEEGFNASTSALPQCPDEEKVEQWLLSVRGTYLGAKEEA